MQFTFAAVIATAVAALVGAVPHPRQSCPEAARFGVLTVSPTTVSAGEVSETVLLLERASTEYDNWNQISVRHNKC